MTVFGFAQWAPAPRRCAVGLVLAMVAPTAAIGAGEPAAQEGQTSGAFDPALAFSDANRLFEGAKSQAQLRKAIAGWQSLLDHGIRNAHLYYNLGNAHLRLREIGPAILHFRRALLYDPEHGRAQAMLAYARKQVSDTFAEAAVEPLWETLFAWHRSQRLSTRLWVAALALAGFWALLAWRLIGRPPFYRTLVAASCAVGLAMLASAAIEVIAQPGEAAAVIVAPEAVVRSGNSAEYKPVFEKPVQSGVEVTILETRSHWHQVEFPGGAVGWVQASAAEKVAAAPN